MPHDSAALVAAGPQDAERVIATLMLAFATDPPNRWMYPDAHDYVRHFPKLVHGLGGAAFAAGTAFMTRDGAGAILWLAPGVEPDAKALMRLAEETLDETRRAQLGAAFEQMGRYHPQEPHWYLPFIGVDPARQGQGIGAALLRPILEKCDAERFPAYLESSNPRNRPLYQRHGFEIMGEIKVGSCPPVTPMLRKPR